MQDKASPNTNIPLVVDLDGTLIRTDLLHESVFVLLKLNIMYAFMLPLWLLKGKAHMKQQIAERVELYFNLLPYDAEFLEYLQGEHEAGRRLILATASNQAFADGVAAHLGVFDTVIGSSPTENNSGKRKLARIRSILNDSPFAYAGNSSVDVPIWKESAEAVLVNAPGSVQSRAQKVSRVVGVFNSQRNLLMSLARALRPHQWLKNLLVFVPLGLTQSYFSLESLQQVLLAFAAFSLCASSVYILNDLLDLPSDRQHPRKRKRPLAAGDLPILYGLIAQIVLLVISMGIALLLPPYFFPVLVLYYGCTVAYSLWLKRAALLDAVMLAILYTLRLVAGAAAIYVAPTFWLLAFSMFLFMSLALIKRYSELLVMQTDGKAQLAGRAYQAVDTETLAQLGAASGYVAVLVLAFYINSDKVFEQYARPEALWLLCPMMMYWISRMWLITRRGEMHDDPVVFTIRDPRTYRLALLACMAFLSALYWPSIRVYITPLLPGL